MGNNVFANGREISCKAADGKSICAFPDVCFTPPTTPATPPGVPIPYPNTAFAKDTAKGSKKVKISGKEIMLKNKSYFKKSTGDEAGSAPKKGVITSTNRGKVYYTSWSMDVKFEGQNVDRHFDLTTQNHASVPGNTIPWLYTDTMNVAKIPEECKKEANEFNEKCGKHVKRHPDGSINAAGTNEAMCGDDAPGGCKEARECILTPYNMGCCDGKTPHHVVPKAQFKERGGSAYAIVPGASYDPGKAPCVCVTGTSHSNPGDHKDIHTETNILTVEHQLVNHSVTGKTIAPDARWPACEAEKVGAQATHKVTGCKEECIEDQARKGHQDMGVEPGSQIRPSTAGRVPDPSPSPATGFPP